MQDLEVASHSQTETVIDIDAEILEENKRYSLEPRIQRIQNPSEWWAKNKERFSLLALSARKSLAIPPSSVPSERIFSTAGQSLNEKRERESCQRM